MVYPGYSSPIEVEYGPCIADREALGPRTQEGPLASIPVFCAEVSTVPTYLLTDTQGHLHCTYASGRIRSRRWV